MLKQCTLSLLFILTITPLFAISGNKEVNLVLIPDSASEQYREQKFSRNLRFHMSSTPMSDLKQVKLIWEIPIKNLTACTFQNKEINSKGLKLALGEVCQSNYFLLEEWVKIDLAQKIIADIELNSDPTIALLDPLAKAMLNTKPNWQNSSSSPSNLAYPESSSSIKYIYSNSTSTKKLSSYMSSHSKFREDLSFWDAMGANLILHGLEVDPNTGDANLQLSAQEYTPYYNLALGAILAESSISLRRWVLDREHLFGSTSLRDLMESWLSPGDKKRGRRISLGLNSILITPENSTEKYHSFNDLTLEVQGFVRVRFNLVK